MARIAHGITRWNNGNKPTHHIQYVCDQPNILITSDKRTSAVWSWYDGDENKLKCEAFIVRRARSNAALSAYPPTALTSSVDIRTTGPCLIGVFAIQHNITRIWSDGLVEQWDQQMERCLSTFQINTINSQHITIHHVINPIHSNNLQQPYYTSYSRHSNLLHILNQRFESIQRLFHISCIVKVLSINQSIIVLCEDGMLYSWPFLLNSVSNDQIVDINQSTTARCSSNEESSNMSCDTCHLIPSHNQSMMLVTTPHCIMVCQTVKLTMMSSLSIQSSVFSAVWLEQFIWISFHDASIQQYNLISLFLHPVFSACLPQSINQSTKQSTNHSAFLLHVLHTGHVVGANFDGNIAHLNNVSNADDVVDLSLLADSFRSHTSSNPSSLKPDSNDVVSMSALLIDSSSKPSSDPSSNSSSQLSITLVQTHLNDQITFLSVVRSSDRPYEVRVDSPHQIPITMLVCYHSWEVSLGHSILVSGTTDGLICVWNCQTATLLRSVRLPCSIVKVHRILNESANQSTNQSINHRSLLAVACADQSLRLLSLPDLQMCTSLRGHLGKIEFVFMPSAISPCDIVCSLTSEGLLYTWSMIDGSVIDLISGSETERILPLLLPDHVNHVRDICNSTFSSPAISPQNSEHDSKVTSPVSNRFSFLAQATPQSSSTPPLSPALAAPVTPSNRNWSLKQMVKRSSTGWLSKNLASLAPKPPQAVTQTGFIKALQPGDERWEPLVQFLFSSPELQVSAFAVSVPAWIELIRREYVTPHSSTSVQPSEPFVFMIRSLLCSLFSDASERVKNLLISSFNCDPQFHKDDCFAYTTHESLVMLTPLSSRNRGPLVQAIRAINATSVLFTLLSVSDPLSLPCFALIEAEIHASAESEDHLPSVFLLLYFVFHSDFAVSQASWLLLKDRISKLSATELSSLTQHYSEIINCNLMVGTPYAPARTLSASHLSVGSPSSPRSLSTNSFMSTRTRQLDGGDLSVHLVTSTPSVDELTACLFLAQTFVRTPRAESRSTKTVAADHIRGDSQTIPRCFDETYSLKASINRLLLSVLHLFDPWSVPANAVDVADVESNNMSAVRVVLELLCMDALQAFDSASTPDSEVESCVFDILSIINAQTDMTQVAAKLLSHITCHRPNVVFTMLPSTLSESGTALLTLSAKKLCLATVMQALRSSLTWDLTSAGLTSVLRCVREDSDLLNQMRDQLAQIIRTLCLRYPKFIHCHELSHRLAFIMPSSNNIVLYDLSTADRYRCLETSVGAQVIQFAPNGNTLASYHPCGDVPSRSLHTDCQVLIWSCQLHLPKNTSTMLKVIDVPDYGTDVRFCWQTNDVVQLKQDEISITLHI